MQTTYYIARVDPCMYLVLLLEGKRRPSEKTTQVRLSVRLVACGASGLGT